jgi:hypothetical protein
MPTPEDFVRKVFYIRATLNFFLNEFGFRDRIRWKCDWILSKAVQGFATFLAVASRVIAKIAQ